LKSLSADQDISGGIGTVNVRYKIYPNRLAENRKREDFRERPLLLNCNVYNGLINKISMAVPGWPNGSGGGLQSRYMWVQFPSPAFQCEAECAE
jgi:hypothetical protein